MARVDFSWISGLADPLIEAAKQQQATNLVADYYASQNKPAASAAMPAGNLGAPVAAPSPFSDTPVPRLPSFAAIQGQEPSASMRGFARAAGESALPAPPITQGTALPSFAAIQGDTPKAKIAGLVQSAAQKYGVDPSTLVRIAQVESGLNPNAKNPNSSAGGLGQFIDTTWAQYGGGASKFDPNASADAMARLTRDNTAGLRQTLGRDPTPGELYLSYQQGLGGATKLLSNPQARAVDIVGDRAVRLNGGTPDMTAGQFAALWSRKVGGGPTQAASAADLPASGALPTQGFVPPGGAAPAAPAAAGRESIPPQLIAMLRNPLTMALAQKEIENLSKGRKVHVIGDKAYWEDPRRQTMTEIPGVGPSPNWSTFKTDDGTTVAFNPRNPSEMQVLAPGSTWRPGTSEERKAYNTPEGSGLSIGPGGKPQVLRGEKPVQWSRYRTQDGKEVAFNPQTLETKVLSDSGGWRPATEEERQAFRTPQNTGLSIGPGGKPQALQGTVPENKPQSAFDVGMANKAATRWSGYIDAADAARRQLVDVQTMREISDRVGSQGSTATLKEFLGPYAEAAGVDISNLSDLQAYTSIVKRLAPQQRAEGSGSTSNIEYEGFLKSLPTLIQNPAARGITLDTMEALLRDQVELGSIAAKLTVPKDKGGIDHAEAERLRLSRPDPMASFKEWRKQNPEVYGQARKAGAQPEPKVGAPSAPTWQDPPKRVTDAEYQKLPVGAAYVHEDDPEGKLRTKRR